MIDAELPEGDYQTVGGLVLAELQRLPDPGDAVLVTIAAESPDEEDRTLRLVVHEVDRRVPSSVRLERAEPVTTGSDQDDDREVRALLPSGSWCRSCSSGGARSSWPSSSRSPPPGTTGWRRPR
ncbi:transporter associated domain-containing protein [Microbacterium sp. HSID17254]|uniref:transporter associated domain-containing protein n=1 Tax=Microbacterium sp. HSID17254 TaxID=2419509 RepID=UPI00406CC810